MGLAAIQYKLFKVIKIGPNRTIGIIPLLLRMAFRPFSIEEGHKPKRPIQWFTAVVFQGFMKIVKQGFLQFRLAIII